MITQVTIEGFKLLRGKPVPLSRVTTIVGPNNGGKTSFLQALLVWQLALQTWVKRRKYDPVHPENLGAKERKGIGLPLEDFTFMEVATTYELWPDLAVSAGKDKPSLIDIRDPDEHARERIAKTQGTNLALRLGSQLLGLGDLGNVAASLGGQLLTLQFSRSDESDADLVGLELAARGGYQPSAAVSLWQKMGNATGGKQGGLAFLSTHPSGPARIRELEQNVPRVQGLYEAARRNG